MIARRKFISLLKKWADTKWVNALISMIKRLSNSPKRQEQRLVHDCHDLIRIFNHCFLSTHNTQLLLGEDEPIYLPANEERPHHCIYFAHGFFSSALHECAHWLIAGDARRQLEDFGYWYVPDGRTAAQQAIFQSCEVKPQALEWVLSRAAGHRFRVSIDNLQGESLDADDFKRAIYQQALYYCQQGLSARAACFHQALCAFYGTRPNLRAQDFSFEDL